MSAAVTLHSGAYSAVIDPIGARCLQFSNAAAGIRVLHESEAPLLSGIPVLFPVNRIDGGSFTCEGVAYRLPVNEEKTGCALHGSLHNTQFALAERQTDRAVFRYESSGSYPGFPQDFAVSIAYTLDGCELHQTFRIENRSAIPMPILLGFHTAFAIPFCHGSCAEDIRVRADLAAELSRDARHLTSGRAVPDALFSSFHEGTYCPTAPVSRQYLAADSGIMTLTDTRTGIRVRYVPDRMFRYRLFYTHAKHFLCLEPQTCAVNAPNLPPESPDAAYPILGAGQKTEMHSVIALDMADR